MMRSSRSGFRPRQRGFTLLEVLLAFVVFAISFAVVLEIIAGSMRSTVRTKDYSEAALLAQSLMESVGNELPLEPGAYQGETDDGYRWAIEISDFEGIGEDTRTLELAEMNSTQLYWVDLQLSWGDERRNRDVQFTTIRSMLGDGR